jgi:hypothetical protein
VLEGALLPQDLEVPLVAEALDAVAGGRAITLHLAGSVSSHLSDAEQLRAAHTVDDQPGVPDTRSPEERWAADRAYLAANGVAEETLRKREYEMLGAGHCADCQAVADQLQPSDGEIRAAVAAG